MQSENVVVVVLGELVVPGDVIADGFVLQLGDVQPIVAGTPQKEIQLLPEAVAEQDVGHSAGFKRKYN